MKLSLVLTLFCKTVSLKYKLHLNTFIFALSSFSFNCCNIIKETLERVCLHSPKF